MTNALSLHRRVAAIAVPMILSNLTVPLLGMVDTGVAGHLPEPHYLGAVAIGAQIFAVVFIGLNFLRMGTTGVTAQVLGREDAEGIRGALGQSLLLAWALSLGLIALQWPIREFALYLIAPEQPAITAAARVYFDIRIWSAPAVLTNFALVGWFLGMQNARLPLLLMSVINGTNIGLDLWFVFGLGLDVDGIAAASVAAEYLGALLGLALAHRMLARHPGRWRKIDVFHGDRWRRLVTVNANIFLRTILLVGSFAFFTAMGARQGELILAANAVLLNFQNILSYGLDGFAHAAEALTGRALGENRRGRFEAAVRATLLWSLIVALVYAMIYWLAGRHVIDLLTDLPEVRAEAYRYLPWLWLSPLVSVWSFLYDGVFIGATWAHRMRRTMLVSVFACYLPAWYLLQPFGNHGLWGAFMVFFAARGVTMYLSYRQGVRASFGIR